MGRKRGSRFRKAVDAQEQFEQIERAQRKSREAKRPDQIRSISKSRKREENLHKRVRRAADLSEEFDVAPDS
jgi:hypothetical protein